MHDLRLSLISHNAIIEESESLFEGERCFRISPKINQELSARGRKPTLGRERGVSRDIHSEIEFRYRVKRETYRDRTIESDDRRRPRDGEQVVWPTISFQSVLFKVGAFACTAAIAAV
jgi:hypothetical protein